MATGFIEASPRRTARVCGGFYLVTIIAGVFAEFFARGTAVVSGNAAATSQNILANEQMWRFAFAADIIGDLAYITVTFLLYELLKPVNRGISLLAAFFSLVGCAIGGMSGLFHLAPLYWLSGASYLSAFSPAQLQALAYVSVRLHSQGVIISLAFFGVYCLLVGYLVYRSTFIPRTVGVLMMLAGVCWLISTFSNFVAPAFWRAYSDYLNVPCLVGEGGLTLWLLVSGVNPTRWRQQEAFVA
ncbi:MAG: DUF4386 domain-containing protein [Candidatus Eremiobacteraeota bacterium]|nr:DUF4386 domain-containing protein [Candidatus Eremiobacteraeota bacterium]